MTFYFHEISVEELAFSHNYKFESLNQTCRVAGRSAVYPSSISEFFSSITVLTISSFSAFSETPKICVIVQINAQISIIYSCS